MEPAVTDCPLIWVIVIVPPPLLMSFARTSTTALPVGEIVTSSVIAISSVCTELAAISRFES